MCFSLSGAPLLQRRWCVSGQRARIREGVAESSSIYSVCGGGCWAGTYNSNTASSSPDSQCTVFVFLLTKAFVFRRSYISIVVCLCASNCLNCCYHKMSGSVWQKVFNKLKISNLLFYETLLDSPANIVVVWCFDIMHDTLLNTRQTQKYNFIVCQTKKLHIESTVFSEEMPFPCF